MVDGTKDSIKEVATAIVSGMQTNSKHENNLNANFCVECGKSLQNKSCSKCKEENHYNANFCNKCGNKL